MERVRGLGEGGGGGGLGCCDVMEGGVQTGDWLGEGPVEGEGEVGGEGGCEVNNWRGRWGEEQLAVRWPVCFLDLYGTFYLIQF